MPIDQADGQLQHSVKMPSNAVTAKTSLPPVIERAEDSCQGTVAESLPFLPAARNERVEPSFQQLGGNGAEKMECPTLLTLCLLQIDGWG